MACGEPPTIEAALETAAVSASLAAWPARRTVRLRLMALRPADAGRLRAITDDRLVAARIQFLAQPFTRAAALGLIRRGRDGRERFVGVWRGARLIGVVGTHLAGEGAIEIGYWIGRGARGKGYATEAARAVVQLLARRHPARRIFAECRRDNRASWRVLTRLGFRPTGEAGARPGREVLGL